MEEKIDDLTNTDELENTDNSERLKLDLQNEIYSELVKIYNKLK